MRIIIGILIFVCALQVFVSSACAEQYNLEDMLCTEFTMLQMEDPNRAKEIMAWFDGYFGGKRNDLIYDVDEDEAHQQKILGYCKEHPLSYVMQAASKYFH